MTDDADGGCGVDCMNGGHEGSLPYAGLACDVALRVFISIS